MTCAKTQEFLAHENMETYEVINARKTALTKRDMLELVRGVDEIYVAKGRKVVHLDLRKEKPDTAALEQLLLGPTGNLRAPTLRKGKMLIVGFAAGMYQQVFRHKG